MIKGVVWTDKEVKSWGKKYLKKRETLESLEQRIDVSHSTLWWCFVHRLEAIDPELFDSVTAKLEANKHHGGRKS